MTVLLATGADRGYLRPRGCYGSFGGALYRPRFDQWLARTRPGVARIWISSGGVTGPIGEDRDNQPPGVMFEQLKRTGYSAVGLDYFDLSLFGPRALQASAARVGLELLTSNLRILETGRPLGRDSLILDSPSGKIGLVAVMTHRPDEYWGDPGSGTILTFEPVAALRPIVASLRRQVRQVVLLSSLGKVELGELLREVPGIDLVFATQGTVEDVAPERLHTVPVLWLGHAGRVLGRVALDDAGHVLEAQGVWVRDAFPIDPLSGEARGEDLH
ncbi:MAG: hypothetical protein Q9Q40_14895 [Acidobacteriota bacterium]|nr:hypothetical protein [Acidobacteriota bacterium]